MRVEPTGNERRFVLAVDGLPPSCRDVSLLHMWEGGFVGQAAFVDEHARVETDATELGDGRARFTIRW